MREKDQIPEHLRCKRTDGRQWRCKRQAMEGRTLCDVHHQQGKHRSNKEKVPESLKLERTVTKKMKESSVKVAKSAKLKRRRRCISETLDEALKKLKLKRGDMQLELIRVFLKRQVEKKKERELKESAIEDETRELPYGVMAISQSPVDLQSFQNGGGGLDVKLGVDLNGGSYLQRSFRSKNIEPLPIGTMQAVPFAEIVKKKKTKKCHWCKENKYRCLIKCSNCRSRFFCLDCIKERYLEKQEVKIKCPACRGTCNCKICTKLQNGAFNSKDCYRGKEKIDRIQRLRYLIAMLLPVLKQMNRDKSIELEREAAITGKQQSEIHIPQTKLGFKTMPYCNKCKTTIWDYHRTCTKCSYILCLSCCHELSQPSSKIKSSKKRKISLSDDEILIKQNISISCPHAEIGGCGETLLDLRCIFPFTWTKDLEIRADKILCNYKLPENSDSCCSCPQREMSRRVGCNDNYLYCPSIENLTLEHFQSHWGKGHPVVVRKVLRSKSGLCWDPIIMFSAYMENKSSEVCKENGMNASNCLDWCEVEIDRKRIFMGSLERRTHASIRQKVVKFKAWLSFVLFQKQFPHHFNEIFSALPLPEYIDPVSGLLNVGVKLPNEFPKPDLGPSIYFSYGDPEGLTESDFLSKLCYESHDTVNILAYATDLSISSEQTTKIENLMKKYNARDQNPGQSFSNPDTEKSKSSEKSENTGESVNTQPPYVAKVPFYSLKDQTLNFENGNNYFNESESDTEASLLCCGTMEKSEDSDEYFEEEDIDNTMCSSKDNQAEDSCGAQWDIFRREDVPKLIEYLRRHSNELTSGRNYLKHVHPILDQNFFLDPFHKLKLKEEFDIEPWTFKQCPGEAIFIPAGCPYQVRKIKSCVSIVLDFISPENVAECIQLIDKIRLLPLRHKAKEKLFEVKRMAHHGISAAIEDIFNLTHVEQVCQ